MMGRVKQTQSEVINLPELPVEHGLNQQQMSTLSQEISNSFGDGQIYDRIRVVNEARFYMAQSAEAMLEVGKRLIVLKENEAHGDFAIIAEEQLGIDVRIAQKMMQAAAKFLTPKLQSNAKSISHLGKTKLYALMLEDDDELAALAEGGTVAGLTLDEIDRMSCRELRNALREGHENYQALSQLQAKTNVERDQLKLDLAKRDRPTITAWDQRVAPFQEEITQRQSLIDAALGQHLKAVEALDSWLTTEITSMPGYDPEATFAMPKEIQAVLLHLDDTVNRCAATVAGLRHELNLRFSGDIETARQFVLLNEAE
jgi:hypothetical protein